MSSEFWPVFFLAVVLKIPIVAMCLVIWWAIRATPEPETAGGDDGHPRRFGPHPRPRGPHGPVPSALPACPPGGRFRARIRPVPARTDAASSKDPSDRV